ncbi:hypothetical protein BGZ75_003755 [Mortierella antarctica]|nr:hypothetical protein BGZ75_003755 [Mortierella antarctica]
MSQQHQSPASPRNHSHSNGHASSSPGPSSAHAPPPGSPSAATSNAPPVPHIRIVPHMDAPRSLHFDVVDKDVPEGFVLKIGRFTDKQALPNRVTFKSKVVSRGHAEIYTDRGKFYIRDTKSSSGTFLNHARLSPPGVESKPTQLKDGDVVQLGVDYQGGTQEIYRCVKMRLELNRSWQQQANPFRMNTLKVIRSLTTATAASSTDCCICLFRIASFQSLFVAPCSHVYHYKCIRPLLMANHPGFLCPLCRTFADLEDTVEIDDPIEEEIPAEDVAAAIENATRAQEATVEHAGEAPMPQVEMPPVEEEAYAPTPPSVQAHTFQPPDNGNFSMNHGLAPSHLGPDDLDYEMVQDTAPEGSMSNNNNNNNNNNAPLDAEGTHITSTALRSPPPSLLTRSPAADTAPCPMDITMAGPSSTGSLVSANGQSASVQQSPTSAFFMAPSPPMFASSTGVTPILVGSPSRTQPQQGGGHQHHVPVSPSNTMAAAGHMLQNFVRNITIPTRNRTRTNSNSPLNPVVQQQQNQQNQQQQQQQQHRHHHQEEASSPVLAGSITMMDGQSLQLPHHAQASQTTADVFGKTLVTPPPLILEDAGAVAPVDDNSNSNGSSQGCLGLESVEEMDSEPSSSQPAGEFSQEHNGLHQGQQQHSSEEEEGQQQQQQQQHLAQTRFTLAAETSV